MKKRFSDVQIIGFLREVEAGIAVNDLCRRHGFSEANYYLWQSKFGGMTVPDAKRLKALEQENTRLKNYWLRRCWSRRSPKRCLEKSGTCTGSSGGGTLDGWPRPGRAMCLEGDGHGRQQLVIPTCTGPECRTAECYYHTSRSPSAVQGWHDLSQVAAAGAPGQSQTGRLSLYRGPVTAAAPHPQEGARGAASAAGMA